MEVTINFHIRTAPAASEPASTLDQATLASTSAAPADPEVELQLQRILHSTVFCKAYRLSLLLRFLLACTTGGARGLASEYAIGIEVFGRDAATYSTGDDPIVRVQVGRLRDKLKQYYAGEGKHDPLAIRIPLGSYLPRIERTRVPPGGPACLAFAPFGCIGATPAATTFAEGLNQELRHRLHRAFGDRFATFPDAVPPAAQLLENGVTHLLEGSVRHEGGHTRTAMRLVALARNSDAWSEQFDHGDDLSIARQEQLAHACCAAVQEHIGTP